MFLNDLELKIFFYIEANVEQIIHIVVVKSLWTVDTTFFQIITSTTFSLLSIYGTFGWLLTIWQVRFASANIFDHMWICHMKVASHPFILIIFHELVSVLFVCHDIYQDLFGVNLQDIHTSFFHYFSIKLTLYSYVLSYRMKCWIALFVTIHRNHLLFMSELLH